MTVLLLRVARDLLNHGQSWVRGLVASLQVHKCVICWVLDTRQGSGLLAARLWKCTYVNGMYLISWLLWVHGVAPLLIWAAEAHVAPAWGRGAAEKVVWGLGAVVQAAWLLPTYLITLFVSCAWYQDIATAAVALQHQPRHGGRGGQTAGGAGGATPRPAHSAPIPSALDASSASGGALAAAAAEVYRVVLFVVFYAQVMLLSKVPVAGPALNTASLSWLYAFYCFDYKWSLAREPLPTRIAFFETRWAFFSGFGLPLALLCSLCPFHLGAGLSALLFPVFILVACDTQVDALPQAVPHTAPHTQPPARSGVAGAPPPFLLRCPIFGMALWPTNLVLHWLLTRHANKHKLA